MSNPGVSISRNRNNGDNRFYNPPAGDRFYNPPAVRRYRQQMLQQQQQQQNQKPLMHWASVDSVTRKKADDCGSSSSAQSEGSGSREGRRERVSNFNRFLESTTPVVPAQHFSKTSMRGLKAREDEFHPYFVLGDLWNAFKEWSVYGAGVPLLMDGRDSVVQYYVPYLSAIQLYIDPSQPSPGLSNMKPGEDSDAESSRETSSDESSDCEAERSANDVLNGAWSQQNVTDANTQSLNRLSLINKPFMGPSRSEGEISNTPGLLMFEYLEWERPFSREPLTDKMAVLASQFPELRTYRSCDLLPSSWISVAWYPIYRIPMGQTLQNLDACFLTFHHLSTPLTSKNPNAVSLYRSSVREFHDKDNSTKLLLPIFGLASYKVTLSVWNLNETIGYQKAVSLLQAADEWIRILQVKHPDYSFFVSRDSYWSPESTMDPMR